MAGLRHRDPGLHAGKAAADGLQHIGETGMEDNGLRVGVVEQVEELFGPVAVVGVDRCKASLEGGVIGLEIFRAVVEEGRDLRLVVQARGEQVGGERIGAGVELAPGQHPLSLDVRRSIGLDPGDRLPHVREGPRTHRILPNSSSWGEIGPARRGEVNSPIRSEARS